MTRSCRTSHYIGIPDFQHTKGENPSYKNYFLIVLEVNSACDYCYFIAHLFTELCKVKKSLETDLHLYKSSQLTYHIS